MDCIALTVRLDRKITCTYCLNSVPQAHACSMQQQASLALLTATFTATVALGQDAWVQRMSLANRLQEQSRYTEARPLYEKAVQDAEELGIRDLRYAQALNNLAAHYHETGLYGQSEPLYRKAAEMWRTLSSTGRLGVTLSNLGTLYRKTGRYQLALDTFSDADAAIRRAYGPQSPELVTCLINWSEAYRVAGRFDEGELAAAKALAMAEKLFDSNDARLSHSMHAYASMLQSTRRSTEATPLHERALSIRRRIYGDNHPYVAASLTALASIYLEQGRYEDAEPAARQALKIWEDKLGLQHASTAVACNNLAQVYRFEQRYAEAEPLYRRSIDIFQMLRSPEATKPLTNLADFSFERGRIAAALSFYRKAEEIALSSFGDQDPQTTAIQVKVAKLLEAAGRRAEANRLYRQVKQATAGQSFRANP
jgi:tetratricopeptide (TPR) repeat protein